MLDQLKAVDWISQNKWNQTTLGNNIKIIIFLIGTVTLFFILSWMKMDWFILSTLMIKNIAFYCSINYYFQCIMKKR